MPDHAVREMAVPIADRGVKGICSSCYTRLLNDIESDT
jgi:hypothetical protein